MSKTQSSNLPCFALWPLIIDDVMMHARKETRTEKQGSSIKLKSSKKSLFLSLSLAPLLNQALTRHP